jgi:hypothetical protein
MRIATFDGRNQNVLKPAHAPSHSELILYERIVEHLPTSTVYTVVGKPSLARYRYISAIV